MKEAKTSGVYRISGPEGKFYIGSEKDAFNRWKQHRHDLRKGDHANRKLQRAWDKYGEQSFEFSVIEVVQDLAMLIPREQHWIDMLDATVNGYNILKVANSRLGLKTSDETKRKQSLAHTGRKHGPMSEQQKTYYSNLYRGKKLSDETKRSMSESRKGMVFSDERRQKISEALKGKPKTETHREKLSLAKAGRKQSPEHVAKRMLGMRLAREARNQMAA